jgi:hypothetical protein
MFAEFGWFELTAGLNLWLIKKILQKRNKLETKSKEIETGLTSMVLIVIFPAFSIVPYIGLFAHLLRSNNTS